MISEIDALEAAREFWRGVDTNVVVDRLVQDDTHYGVCTRLLPDAEWLVGAPILFIRKADGKLEPGSSSDGPRIASMDELR